MGQDRETSLRRDRDSERLSKMRTRGMRGSRVVKAVAPVRIVGKTLDSKGHSWLKGVSNQSDPLKESTATPRVSLVRSDTEAATFPVSTVAANVNIVHGPAQLQEGGLWRLQSVLGPDSVGETSS